MPGLSSNSPCTCHQDFSTYLSVNGRDLYSGPLPVQTPPSLLVNGCPLLFTLDQRCQRRCRCKHSICKIFTVAHSQSIIRSIIWHTQDALAGLGNDHICRPSLLCTPQLLGLRYWSSSCAVCVWFSVTDMASYLDCIACSIAHAGVKTSKFCRLY